MGEAGDADVEGEFLNMSLRVRMIQTLTKDHFPLRGHEVYELASPVDSYRSSFVSRSIEDLACKVDLKAFS